MKKTILVLSFLATNQAMSADEVPKDFSMNCWDGSFAYNRLSMAEKGGLVNIISSGQDMRIFRNLVKNSQSWGQVTVSVILPKANCKAADNDPKVINCTANEATLKVVSPGPTVQEILVKDAVIKVRKVEEISVYGIETKAYELTVTGDLGQTAPLLSQQYFYGLNKDETGNCRIGQ
jgi:hypothetical protein